MTDHSEPPRSTHQAALLLRAEEWVEKHATPLPIDLVTEMLGEGLDAAGIEDQLLSR